MTVDIHLTKLSEQEALNLANGDVSERIASLARKAILAARDHKTIAKRLRFDLIAPYEGTYGVYLDSALYGTARNYGRYWQIYIRSEQRNIRRTTWLLLKLAIEEHIRDAN